MTEQEAIEIIKYASAFNSDNSPLTKALDMAIKALEKIPLYEVLEEQCIKECGCGLNMVALKYKEFQEHMHELAEYWELEEQGLLLKLPCQLRDTVYLIQPRWIQAESKIISVVVPYQVTSLDWIVGQNNRNHIGKTVFLSKEEAETALEKMKGGTEWAK